MTRSKRIQRIASMSRNAERVAGQTLQGSKRELEQYQKQLADLLGYREEYRASLRSGSSVPMNGAEAQKIRAFIAQVDTVISGLQAKIEQIEQRYNTERDNWTQQLLRSNALDGVALRAEKQEKHMEEAHAQREIDDRRPLKLS